MRPLHSSCSIVSRRDMRWQPTQELIPFVRAAISRTRVHAALGLLLASEKGRFALRVYRRHASCACTWGMILKLAFLLVAWVFQGLGAAAAPVPVRGLRDLGLLLGRRCLDPSTPL